MYFVDDTKVYTKDDMFKNFEGDLNKCIVLVVSDQLVSSDNTYVPHCITGIYRAVNVDNDNYSVVDNNIGLVFNSLNEKLKDANFDYVNACVNLRTISECLKDLKNKQASKEVLKYYDVVIFNKHIDVLRVINKFNALYDLYLRNCLNDVMNQFNCKNNIFIRSLEKDTFDVFYKDLFNARLSNSNSLNAINTMEYGKAR